jgi:Uma2 family endonuclease
MSTIAKTTTSLAAGGRMTVDEFERFTENLDEPFELIEGLMVAKVTKKPPHVTSTEKVRDELLALFSRPQWRVSTESPVRIPEYNEPEPDVMLIRGSIQEYEDRTPGPADLAIVVEVSHYSRAKDRKRIAIYGTARIPVYWIVNIDDQQVEVYILKRRGGYGKARIYQRGESVPVDVDGIRVGLIAVNDMLPSPEPAAGGNGA